MRTFVLILAVMTLAAPTALTIQAEPPCTGTIPLEWYETPLAVNDPLFSKLFPGLSLVTTGDRARLPEIPEFWAVGSAGACDLDDLAGLLDATGRRLVTVSDYEAAAWLLAQTSDEEVMGVQLFDHVESTVMNTQGADVVLVAKSPATGTLVRWNVDVARDGSGDARWEVLAIEPGLRQDVEGWFIGPGDTGPFEPLSPGVAFTKTRLYPLADGKNVRITYFTQNYGSEAEADADADREGLAGQIAYNRYTQDWGWTSDDPDAFIDITLDGCACIYSGNNVNIHMPANVRQWVNAIGLGLNYPEDQGTATVIVGHEMFHHMQYSKMNWNQANWVIEGTARFSETAHTPGLTFFPATLPFHNSQNGFTYFMQNPHIAPQSHSYSYGLVWGHIYDTNGGIQTIGSILDESAVNPGFPGFIDRALAAAPGDHDTFGDALADLGPRMLVREFVWDSWDGSETYDWGTYLPDAPENTITTAAGAAGLWQKPLPPYAIGLLDISKPGSVSPTTVLAASGPADYRFFFVGVNETGAQTTEFQGAFTESVFTDKHVVAFHHDGPLGVPTVPLLGNAVVGVVSR